MKKCFSRPAVASVGVFLLSLALLALPASPASAAVTTEPVAIAVGRDGDKRVLHIGGDGKSNSSPIVMTAYVPNTNTTSARQRWVIERVTGTGMPTFAYRIKNPATGKCINAAGATPVNAAAIILYTCNGTLSGTNEIWWMNSSPESSGVRIRNKRDNRCMDISGGSIADNAALVNYTCNATYGTWNQSFQVRTGSFNCNQRDRQWEITGLCIRPQPTSGIIGNWFNVPSTIQYRDPSVYVLSNELRSRINADVVNVDNSYTGQVQMGWRALRAPTPTGTVSYNAYWQEIGPGVEEYHAVPAVDPVGSPNGSNNADGAQHTYMMLASATANQWDLFYDFNYVATTKRQSGSRADRITAGLQLRNLDGLTQSEPYEFRVQTRNEAGVWVKPDVAQTALAANKQCGMFLIWEDWGGAGNNQPPWCLSTSRTLTADKTAVDTTKISKPTSPVSLADQRSAKTSPTRSGIVNGVDQALLSRCLATDAAQCLQIVPGLQRCVTQHLRCSASPASKQAIQRSRATVTDADAIAAARGLIHSTEPASAKNAISQAEATRTTLAAAGLPHPARIGLAADTPVYTVTDDTPARSWKSDSPMRYGRWTAVVDATTGGVLYARLDSPL